MRSQTLRAAAASAAQGEPAAQPIPTATLLDALPGGRLAGEEGNRHARARCNDVGVDGTASSLHDAVTAATAEPLRRTPPRDTVDDLQDAIGMQEVPNDDPQSGGFRVRLGREYTVVARCSCCTTPIVEAEVDPLTGKPFTQNGRPYHQECHAYRR
jgi:hypothetical protein